MPELPEVETSRQGITPHILGHTVTAVIVRNRHLRWPVSPGLKTELIDQRIDSIERRGKYLLLKTAVGTVIIHLGMSGSLRIVNHQSPPEKHDHVDIEFDNAKALRLRDPRRFGAVLWTRKDPLQHKLIRQLGPEPLTDDFNGPYLYQASRRRKSSIKSFIMDSHIVVGVGNIYANEALFLAGINPKRQAGQVSRQRYDTLAHCIKQILKMAIEQGGTSLRDFTREDGKPGYFQQTLNVYGKVNASCPHCGSPLKHIRQQQRSTYYCPHCQR
jgi:formamidopyrimidine-DNA glycosylase